MFAFLSGTPVIQKNKLIMLVNGVGYDVDVSTRTLLAATNADSFSLYIHTHVREDRIELYGFQTIEAKEIFNLLIDVSGVGPKTALAITERGSQALIEAVQQADVSFFTKVPRVGKKSAQKIIIELKSKLGGLKELDLGPQTPLQEEISDALLSLGFAKTEVSAVVNKLDAAGLTLESGLQQAIKELGLARAKS